MELKDFLLDDERRVMFGYRSVFLGILFSGMHSEFWKRKRYVRLCDLEEEKEEKKERGIVMQMWGAKK